jgi:hypothetical protein
MTATTEGRAMRQSPPELAATTRQGAWQRLRLPATAQIVDSGILVPVERRARDGHRRSREAALLQGSRPKALAKYRLGVGDWYDIGLGVPTGTPILTSPEAGLAPLTTCHLDEGLAGAPPVGA